VGVDNNAQRDIDQQDIPSSQKEMQGSTGNATAEVQ